MCVCIQRSEVRWGGISRAAHGVLWCCQSQQEASCLSTSSSVWSKTQLTTRLRRYRHTETQLFDILFILHTGGALRNLRPHHVKRIDLAGTMLLNIFYGLYCPHLLEKCVEANKEQHSVEYPTSASIRFTAPTAGSHLII